MTSIAEQIVLLLIAQTPSETVEAVAEATGITLDEVLSWLLIGLFVGSVASAVYLKRPKGFGFFGNLAIGLAGAFLAGVVTDVFSLEFEWGQFVLGVDEIIFALAGAVIVLALLSFLKNRGKPVKPTTPKR